MAFATQHDKARLVEPAFASMGLRVVTAEVETDRFGTFTREVPRPGSAHQTASAKARAALEAMPSAAFGLGSEGSFGPSPVLPLGAVASEVLVLISRDGELTLSVDEVTHETNFGHWRPGHGDPLEWAKRHGFPSHALVVTTADGAVHKGVTSLASVGPFVALETDLRAMVNPTRQRAITRAAEALAVAWHARCPKCQARGFVPSTLERGLPCEACGAPTTGVHARVARCRCGHTRRLVAEHLADVATCPECNP